mgnify:CR=1 FL=1
MRARRIGFDDGLRDELALPAGGHLESIDFTLTVHANVNDQLPANYFYSVLQWPNAKIKGDFSRACANCHQIGNSEFREERTSDGRALPRSAGEGLAAAWARTSKSAAPFSSSRSGSSAMPPPLLTLLTLLTQQLWLDHYGIA